MRLLMFALVLALPLGAGAQTPVTASLTRIDAEGTGASVGSVRFENTRWGLLITPDLHDLPPGPHGFHVHQKPDCGPGLKDGKMQAGLAAGDHYDPGRSERHGGPFSDGHAGDLPVLHVDKQGRATTPVLAPRLKPSDLTGRAVVVHQGGDNYSDQPEPLGGGGERIACGVVE